MLEWITDPNAWLALVMLIFLEIILGIDNIIFLSLVIIKLPKEQQNAARHIGLFSAMLMRLSLLFSISWVILWTKPLFTIMGNIFSVRDLILLCGGLFLLWKSSIEIHENIRGKKAENKPNIYSFARAIFQIIMLDIIFSFDSVITAIGLSDHLVIMMAAVVITVIMMMFAAHPISKFLDSYPSVKMLALAFLVLISCIMILESFNIHVLKGYIYFSIFFSTVVESLNLLSSSKRK